MDVIFLGVISFVVVLLLKYINKLKFVNLFLSQDFFQQLKVVLLGANYNRILGHPRYPRQSLVPGFMS